MRVLVVGGGGREHALAWRLAQSELTTELLIAPGNAGTSSLGENLPVSDTDLDALVAAACARAADLAVIGPETPLAMGLADRLNAAGIPAFGPSRTAARLEASKSFSRRIMDTAGVPGPNYQVFRTAAAALEYITRCDRPLVVKADGLAAGKGVAMCPTRETARRAICAAMDERVFGAAGDTIVIEDWIDGIEVSVFGFTDGAELSPLAAVADYKRIGNGETGANTGGMGSYGPPPFWDDALAEQVRSRFMLPVLNELHRQGSPYRGALYCGVMLTADGPRVLEFNCRLGDPETQILMPQLRSDPVAVMLACAAGRLADAPPVRWSRRPTVGVVMASDGYPGPYPTGYPIYGLDTAADDHTLVFQAGVSHDPNGRPVTAGGRVLTCVGAGDTIAQARERAYRCVGDISFSGACYRTDIAAVPASTAAAPAIA